MRNPVNNKIVLITGASSGIGAACAELFAQYGAKLILCARRLSQLENLAQRLRAEYQVEVRPLQLDVSERSAVANALDSLPEEWQVIDILINNAGLALGLDTIQEGNIDDWEQMIDTNIKGLLYMTRAILPGMIARNNGHIINIGSIAGHEVYQRGNVYVATKHAVRALNQAMKMDLLGTPIRVSSVDPGMVNTEFSTVRFKGEQAQADAVYADMTPLTAEDIADAVFYCATRPPHVNVSELLVLPTDQSAPHLVSRTGDLKQT